MNRPPLDLRNPPIRQAVGGYARSEVQIFLDVVAEDYEAARAALDDLRAEHARVAEALRQAREHERDVARVLSAAEQAAAQILDRARQTAAERERAAEEAAQRLLQQAEAERARVGAEIDRARERQARIVRVLEAEIAALRLPLPEISAGPAVEQALGSSSAISPAVEGGVEHLAASALVSAPAVVAGTGDPSVTPAPLREVEAVAAATPLAADVSPSAPAASEPRPVSAVPEPASQDHERETTIAVADDVREAMPAFDVGALDDASSGVAAPLEPMPEQEEEDVAAAGRSRARRRGAFISATAAAIAILSVAAIPWLRASDAPAAETPTVVHSTPAPVRTPPAPARPASAAVPQPVAHEPLPSADAITVRLEASSPCWIRISSDGSSEERLLEVGETLERTSEGDVVLRTGNAGALKITVNGRPIPPIGGEGEVVTRRITRPVPVSR